MCVYQICCGVWRRRVYHLYSYGFEKQELRLSTGVCLGTRLIRVSLLEKRFYVDEILYVHSGLLIKMCFPFMNLTGMPSEKATVSSKSSKILKKRNLLSLTLELKVMTLLPHVRFCSFESGLIRCIPISSLQGSMGDSCLG